MNSYIFLLFLLLCSVPGFACSCSQSAVELPTPEIPGNIKSIVSQSYAGERKYVFHGRVVGLREVEDQGYPKVEYTYEVIQNFGEPLDSIVRVLTNNSSDACGYYDQSGGESIVTVWQARGDFHTAREDCSKNVSRKRNPVKFERWLSYLQHFNGDQDGKYVVYQTGYTLFDRIEKEGDANKIAVIFSIRNGRLHGPFSLYDREGKLVVKGRYKAGDKNGVWQIPVTGLTDDYDQRYNGAIRLRFRKGKVTRARSVLSYHKVY